MLVLTKRWFAIALIALLSVTVITVDVAHAATSNNGDAAAPWPVAWNAYTRSDGSTINDVNGEISPSGSDIASGTCTGADCVGPDPSVFYYSDGTNIFFRLRLAVDPTDNAKGGIFNNTFLVQIAQAGVVKAVVGVDGKDNSADYVYVTDAVGGTVEPIYTFPWDNSGGTNSNGVRIVSAGSGNYFLDFQVPIGYVTSLSGGDITASSPIQLYFGTSQAANLAVINKDYMNGLATSVSFAGLSTVSMEPADLVVTSSMAHQSGPQPPAVAATTRYLVTVTASNPGGAPLDNTVVTIPIPSGATVSSINPAVGTVSGSGPLTWSVGTLAAGASTTMTYVIEVTPSGPDEGLTYEVVGIVSGVGDDTAGGSQASDTAPALTDGPVGPEPVQYSVTFDLGDGTFLDPVNVVENLTVPEPSAPSRTGFTFAGWTSDADGNLPWNFGTDPVTGPLTLYAQWTPNSYTVDFDSLGGSAVTSQTLLYGSVVSVPTPPSRAHYTFLGWSTSADDDLRWDFADDFVESDLTLFAVWEAIMHSVTFNSSGGSSVAGASVQDGDLVSTPSTPTRPGFLFSGWTTDEEGDNPWDFNSDPVNGAVTLYAQWTPVARNLTYVIPGGSTIVLAVQGDDPVSSLTPQRPGYRFVRWVDADGNTWTPADGVPDAGFTVYAEWELEAAVAPLAETGSDVGTLLWLSLFSLGLGISAVAIRVRTQRIGA